MDTRIEWRMSRRWAVVSEEGEQQVIAFIHEGGDRPQDIIILPGGANPSLLADLRGRRYGSLDAVAEAIGTHLEGACRII